MQYQLKSLQNVHCQCRKKAIIKMANVAAEITVIDAIITTTVATNQKVATVKIITIKKMAVSVKTIKNVDL